MERKKVERKERKKERKNIKPCTILDGLFLAIKNPSKKQEFFVIFFN